MDPKKVVFHKTATQTQLTYTEFLLKLFKRNFAHMKYLLV